MIVSDKAELLVKLQCKSCLQVFDIEKSELTAIVGFPKFCPYCGATNVKLSKIDRYWYDMSEALGFGRHAKGAELIEGLYKLWPTNEFIRFRDFIDSIRNEL
jgi:hypothetical protein